MQTESRTVTKLPFVRPMRPRYYVRAFANRGLAPIYDVMDSLTGRRVTTCISRNLAEAFAERENADSAQGGRR